MAQHIGNGFCTLQYQETLPRFTTSEKKHPGLAAPEKIQCSTTPGMLFISYLNRDDNCALPCM